MFFSFFLLTVPNNFFFLAFRVQAILLLLYFPHNFNLFEGTLGCFSDVMPLNSLYLTLAMVLVEMSLFFFFITREVARSIFTLNLLLPFFF